tara:strand:+ start:581 stop:718 length:138 start_codon:yes stop_codon:yes gene_type:complete
MQNYDAAKFKIAEETPKQELMDESEAADRLSISAQVSQLWRQKRK